MKWLELISVDRRDDDVYVAVVSDDPVYAYNTTVSLKWLEQLTSDYFTDGLYSFVKVDVTGLEIQIK